jgi:hypothetical protein
VMYGTHRVLGPWPVPFLPQFHSPKCVEQVFSEVRVTTVA